MLEALLVAHVLGKKSPVPVPVTVVRTVEVDPNAVQTPYKYVQPQYKYTQPPPMVLDTNALQPPWQGARTALIVVLVVLELILFVCAVFRALKCSQGNPDSRALHLLFATVSPALYLIFSFAVDGFCKPSVK
jgi:hypothetical protein